MLAAECTYSDALVDLMLAAGRTCSDALNDLMHASELNYLLFKFLQLSIMFCSKATYCKVVYVLAFQYSFQKYVLQVLNL